MTPDHYFPGTGTLIQQKLGMRPLPALDIRQQCAGFAYGLQVVDALIRSGIARTVLLVGTDVHTSLMPFSAAHLRGAPRRATRGRSRDEDFAVELPVPPPARALRRRRRRHGLPRRRGRRTAAASSASALYGDGNHKDILYVPGGGSQRRPFVTCEMIAGRRDRAGDGRPGGLQAGRHPHARGDARGARPLRLHASRTWTS